MATSTPVAAHTIVILLDDPEKSAVIQGIYSSHESIEVFAAFANGTSRPFRVNVNKSAIATKLGRKQEATEEMLKAIAARFQQGSGDIVLSRDEVKNLLDKAGETQVIQPEIIDVDSMVLPEGVVYDELEAEADSQGEVALTPFVSNPDRANEIEGRKPTVNLLVAEEDAA